MDFDPVLPNLYVGSCPMNAGDVHRLKEDAGITAVLNLQTEEDFSLLGIDWGALKAYYDEAGIQVGWVPVLDFNSKDLRRNLPRAVQVLDEFLRAGHTAYVHCTAGVNRSPTTVIAYLYWMEHRELGEALDVVFKSRPCKPYIIAVVSATEDRKNGA